jgi:glycosyltransferase involved in cell wall biosynthesis
LKDISLKFKKRFFFLIGESYLYLFYLLLYINVLIIKKSKTKNIDIAFFPYSSPSSIGSFLRIKQYEPLFKANNIKYKVFYCITDEEEKVFESLSFLQQYILFSKILVRRIKAIKIAKTARVAFVQRSMFPFYINQKRPLMEKILKKQGCYVVIDFWDSVWEKNKYLTDNSAKIANLITVSNSFLMRYFAEINNNIQMFNIAVDNARYVKKKDYSISGAIKLAYIGYPSNVNRFIEMFRPIAIKLKEMVDFKLVIISNGKYDVSYCKTEYYPFDYSDFSNILSSCDIGLYLVEKNDISEGKSAMKVMDYLACGLPVVASPWGVNGFEHTTHLLLSNSDEEFLDDILMLANDIELRTKLGTNAQQIISEQFSLEKSIKIYENICAV